MTNAICTPSPTPVPLQEREQRPDRLGWLGGAVKGMGVEADSIHQLLRHEQLI